MNVIIQENQRGLLFKNGKFEKCLGPGKYFALRAVKGLERRVWELPFSKRLEVVPCEGLLSSTLSDQKSLLGGKGMEAETCLLTVERGELGFRFVDGAFTGTYTAGMYAFWNVHGENSFLKADITTPYVAEDFPCEIFPAVKPSHFVETVVDERAYGMLFIDGKFQKLLPAGRHFFWKGNREITVRCVPACLVQEDIVGQEILTADKVSLRINCVCDYTVVDPVSSILKVKDVCVELHTIAQLALREYVGEHSLDEILRGKEEMSAYLLDALRARAGEFFLEIRSAAVKDIILPGEIRDIMNTVLIAEKRAQASLITRREEVASTRSLLNTAKLMEENATLYKLKQLEYVERICEKVGSIHIGSGDLLGELTKTLAGGGE